MSLISCKNIVMTYDGTVALNNVSFNIEQGEYLCVVGENGSGKSTLMKGILGLVPLKSGEIVFGDGLRRNEIGYLPQQTIVQKDFPASVYEVVLSGCLNKRGLRPFYSRADKKRADDNIRLLKIEDIVKKSYRELSGGQQQRVLLARALCATEKLLLLDEPATGLDPTATASLYECITRLNTESGVTIIMVTHDVEGAIKNAHTILHLDTEIVYFGSAHEYCQCGKGFKRDESAEKNDGGDGNA